METIDAIIGGMAVIMFFGCIYEVLTMPREEHKKMKRIYLSHPYGGNEANRAKAACLAKFYRDIWEAEGKDWELVNPLEELENMKGVDDETALFAAVALMMDCDAVLFAPGWKRSRGCRYEHLHSHKMDVYEIPEGVKVA